MFDSGHKSMVEEAESIIQSCIKWLEFVQADFVDGAGPPGAIRHLPTFVSHLQSLQAIIKEILSLCPIGRARGLTIEIDDEGLGNGSVSNSDGVPDCISLDSAMRPVSVERVHAINDTLLSQIARASSCPVELDTLRLAVGAARNVADQKGHHGLMMVIGNWKPLENPQWCKQHARLLGFNGRSPEGLQQDWKDCSLASGKANEYILSVSMHEEDHDGAIGFSPGGFLVLPRVQFEALQTLRCPQVPEDWGCRRTTAQKMTREIDCICIVVSEETGKLLIFTAGSVYIQDVCTSSCSDTFAMEEEIASPYLPFSPRRLSRVLEDTLDGSEHMTPLNRIISSNFSVTASMSLEASTPLSGLAAHYRSIGASPVFDGRASYGMMRSIRGSPRNGSMIPHHRDVIAHLKSEVSSWKLREDAVELLRHMSAEDVKDVFMEELTAVASSRTEGSLETRILIQWLLQHVGLGDCGHDFGLDCRSIRKQAETNPSILRYVDPTLFTELAGHVGSVNALVFTDCNVLCSASDDHTVVVWDAVRCACRLKLEGHTMAVTSLATHGDVLCSGSEDALICIWTRPTQDLAVADLKSIGVLHGHKHTVTALAFAGGDAACNLCSCSDDSDVRLWDVSGLLCLKVLRGCDAIPLCFVIDRGAVLYTGYSDGALSLWDMQNATCISTIQVASSKIITLAAGDDKLCLGLSCATIQVWDTQSSDFVGNLSGHEKPVRSLILRSPFLYSSSDDGSVRLWCLTAVSLICVVAHGLDSVRCMVYANHELWLGTYDAAIFAYTMRASLGSWSSPAHPPLRHRGPGDATDADVRFGRREVTGPGTPVVRTPGFSTFRF